MNCKIRKFYIIYSQFDYELLKGLEYEIEKYKYMWCSLKLCQRNHDEEIMIKDRDWNETQDY